MEGRKRSKKTHHVEPEVTVNEEKTPENKSRKRRHQDGEATGGESSKAKSKKMGVKTSGREGHDEEQEMPQEKRFKYQAFLGDGAYGRVYLVKDRCTKKKVALKIIRKAEGRRRHFEVEKKILEETSECPFVIHKHLTTQSKTFYWIAMEYAPGGDFLHLLQKRGRLDLESVRFYAAEIAVGLQYLHNKGFIHRDIKLENVLIGADGHVRISDFGLSIEAEIAQGFAGTRTYAAPEMLNGKPYNAAADWYSFGVLLCEMATGDPPNSRNDFDHLDLDPHLEDLIKKLLSKNPKDRLQVIRHIRTNPFFSGINWDDLEHCKVSPPFVPS